MFFNEFTLEKNDKKPVNISQPHILMNSYFRLSFSMHLKENLIVFVPFATYFEKENAF